METLLRLVFPYMDVAYLLSVTEYLCAQLANMCMDVHASTHISACVHSHMHMCTWCMHTTHTHTQYILCCIIFIYLL